MASPFSVWLHFSHVVCVRPFPSFGNCPIYIFSFASQNTTTLTATVRMATITTLYFCALSSNDYLLCKYDRWQIIIINNKELYYSRVLCSVPTLSLLSLSSCVFVRVFSKKIFSVALFLFSTSSPHSLFYFRYCFLFPPFSYRLSLRENKS
jgi:hypothetical protein